ncbi:MAG: ABC transporter permease [Acidobacteriaceae bacterium]
MSLTRRLLNLFSRDRIHRDIDAEFQAHIDLRALDNIAAGMSPENARRDARLRFGNPIAQRERTLASDAALTLDSLGRDIRYALRQLQRSPGFAATALITLALGIGANVIVFGVLNAVLLHPLEVRDPQSLYQLRHKPWASFRLITTSYPDFQDFRRRNTSFTGMAAIDAYSSAALLWHNATVEVHGDEVSGNYFDLLGVMPQAGRFFHAADEHGPNSAPYVVLSDALWRSAFQADPNIIGATVELNQHPFTVIGVSSPQFHGTERFVWPDYWIPIVNEQQLGAGDFLHDRTSVAVTVIGRLKPGVTSERAIENLDAIAAQLAKEYPQTDDGQPLRLIHPGLYGDDGEVIRGFLWSVTALALLVLAAACANLASLFAARAADRSRELALRVALGSSRHRLMRQLLTEAVIVSLIGGAAGFAGASLLLRVLNRWNSPYGHLPVSVDARLYLAGLAFTFASALLFGILPARRAWQSSPLQAMKSGPAESTPLRRFALRDLLLGAQIAVCTLLVTASLVAVRGMTRALQVPLGFEPRGAMLADLDLSHAGYPDNVVLEKQKAVIEAAQHIPGVVAAGTASRTPMTGGMHGIPIFLPGTADFNLNNSVLAPYVFTLSPGYFEAAGTRLLSGRDVSWQDTNDKPSVAIVNATFARRMWPHTPPIGQRFILFDRLTEVIGVVEDGKYHDLQEPPQPVVYLPLPQTGQSETILVVRSRLAPSQMAAALQRSLSAIVPNLPITFESWPESLRPTFFPAQAATVALGAMGLLAAMLALTGLFGMAAYSVSKRMKELGIRVALGARRTQVVSAAIGRPIILLAVGSTLGLLAGIFFSPLLGHIVDQANPRDPLVLLGAMVTMVALGAAASAIPARRALRINPSTLMRDE